MGKAETTELHLLLYSIPLASSAFIHLIIHARRLLTFLKNLLVLCLRVIEETPFS